MITNDISTSLRTPAQIPVNGKGYFLSEAEAANLGTSNNLAFTYEQGMMAYCALEDRRYEWREVRIGDAPGLIPTNFTYPAGWVVEGINYSGKQFNFFRIDFTPAVVIPLATQLLQTLSISTYWKKGQDYQTKTKEQLPALTTNSVYTRNGYIGGDYIRQVEGNIQYGLTDTYELRPVIFEAYIYNLGVQLHNYDLVKNYSPKLVISKFVHTKRRKDLTPEEDFPIVSFRRAGYKFKTTEDLIQPHKLPINAQYQVYDFGQEHYFKTTKAFQLGRTVSGNDEVGIFRAKGLGYRNTRVRLMHGGVDRPVGYLPSNTATHSAYVYLNLHVEITIDGVKYMSPPLKNLKMELISAMQEGPYNFDPEEEAPMDYFSNKLRTRIIFKDA